MVELYNFLTLDQAQVIIINSSRAAGISQAFTNGIAGLSLLNWCAFLDFLINSCDQVYKPSLLID